MNRCDVVVVIMKGLCFHSTPFPFVCQEFKWAVRSTGLGCVHIKLMIIKVNRNIFRNRKLNLTQGCRQTRIVLVLKTLPNYLNVKLLLFFCHVSPTQSFHGTRDFWNIVHKEHHFYVSTSLQIFFWRRAQSSRVLSEKKSCWHKVTQDSFTAIRFGSGIEWCNLMNSNDSNEISEMCWKDIYNCTNCKITLNIYHQSHVGICWSLFITFC